MKRNRKHPQGESIEVDTSNILFVCSGAFVGMDAIKKTDLGVGFLQNKTAKNNHTQTTEDHLIKYGLIPEFVGRIGNIVELEKLTVKELAKIITDSKISPFLQYQNILKTEGIELTINKDAITKIAENCYQSDIGARGIKNYFDNILRETLFNIVELKDKKLNKITINRQSVDNLSDPTYNYST